MRSEAYRRLVAGLPCMLCGIEGSSQAAHPNHGKGLALKTSDLLCFPLCHDGANGCHTKWDTYRYAGRERQAALEPMMAAATRRELAELADTDRSAAAVLHDVGLR